MSKIKLKSRKIIKKHDEETYIFKNGFSVVPGCCLNGKQMLVSLKDFMQVMKGGYDYDDNF